MSQDSIEPYNEHNQYYGEKGEAVQNPMVKDLPSAINYIKHLTSQLSQQQSFHQEMKLNAKIKSEQYENIQQELLELENQKLHIEQEMLEFAE